MNGKPAAKGGVCGTAETNTNDGLDGSAYTLSPEVWPI